MPNFSNNGSLPVAINAVFWILWAVAATAVILRFVARSKRSAEPAADDWVMVVALIIGFANGVITSLGVANGVGSPTQDVISYPSQFTLAVLYGNISTFLGLITLWLPKFAIAILINRIFVPSPAVRWFNYGIVIILMILCWLCMIVLWAQCSPAAFQWDPFHNVGGSCWDPHVFLDFGVTAGSIDSFVDLWFIVYPTFTIFKLKMSLRKKIVASIAMSLGVVTLFTTIYKTAAVLSQFYNRQADLLYISGQTVLWTAIEANVTIIVGCIPTWGWLIKIDGLEKIVTWVSNFTTLRRRGSSEKLSDGEEVKKYDVEGGQKLETISDRRPAKRPVGTAIDSIAALERSALR